MMKNNYKSLVRLIAASLIGLVGVIGTLLLLPQVASARPMLDGAQPIIENVTHSTPAIEGAPITVTVTASDPDTDTLYYSFDWDGDGSFSGLDDIQDDPSNQASHTWVEGGTFIITVGVCDDITSRVTETVTITVTAVNDPPSITSPATASVPENQTAATDVEASDPDGDSEGAGLTYSLTGGADQARFSIDADDGTLTFNAAPDFEAPADADGDNDYVVEVTVTDSTSLTDAQVLTITVTNVNEPPVVSDIPDQTIDEGQSFTTIDLDAYVSDPDDADAEITWTHSGETQLTVSIVNRVATISTPGAQWSGSETITFRATDPGNLWDEDATTFTVNNIAPTITGVTDTGPVDEGTPVIVIISATDPGGGTLHYGFDWNGNGSFTDSGDIPSQSSNQASHTWGDDDAYAITVLVTDEVAIVTDTTTITVNNVAPIVDAGSDQHVYEGQVVHFTGVFTDVSADTHDIVWDFGDGATATGTLAPTHVYSEPAVFVATLTVTDDDDGVGSDTTTVTVQNLPPNADAGGPYAGTAGAPVTLSASTSTDPGGGPLTFAWDLDDDGSFDDATGAVVNHTWTVAGPYTVTVQATDAQSATDTDTAQVSVGAADLDHIVLSPSTATVLASQDQAYTVEAFDVYGNSRGDVTAQVTFAILEPGHGGSWTDNVYTPGNPGDWTVQATHSSPHTTTDEASLTVLSPIMHIEKSGSPDVVEAGATLTYTLAYSNTGNSTAVNVVITDTLDPHTSFASATPAPIGGLPDAPVWSISSVAPDQSGQITLIVDVDSPLPNNTLLANTAWLDTPQTTPVSAASQTTVSSRPVLTITKTGNPDPVPAGQNLVYTIVATNIGNENASSVTVVEEYDPNVSFVYASRWPDPGSGNRRWTLGTLAVDTPQTLQVVVRVADALPVGTTITNVVTLDSAQTTPISIMETTQALSASDLEITQAGYPDPVSAGDGLTYVIWYENTGSAPATNVVLTATYDSRVTFLDATPSPDAGNNVWEIGTVGVDEGGSIIVEVEVDTPLPNGSLLENVVTIGSDETSPAAYVETTLVESSPDLSFSITQQPETTVEAGAPLTYTLSYVNTGNADATQAIVTATLDGLTSFSSATPPPSGGAGNVWYWEIPTIPGEGGHGEIVIYTQVTLPIASGTSLNLSAQLADTEGDFLEETAQVVVTSAPALSLSKSDGVSTVHAGDVLTYTLAYANNGNEDAHDIVITDTLPSNYTQYQRCEISGGTCAYLPATNRVTFHIPTLAAQTGGQALLVLQVDDPLPAGAHFVTNRATLAHASLSAPITRQDIDVIGTLPDLGVSVTHAPSLFSPDRPMTYTLTYGNAGRMHAEDVVITTTLPPGTTYEGFGWSSTDGQAYTYVIGDLPAGDTGNTAVFTVKHLSGTIGASEFDTAFTIGETGSAGGDANPGDNVAEAYIGVPDLVVTKFTVAPMPLQANVPITFTIVVKNQGTGMAWNPESEGGCWIDLFTAPIGSYPSQGYGIAYAGIPPLAPGKQHTAIINHTFTEQEILEITGFYVRADNEKAEYPYGLVPESDEMNNIGGPIQPLNLVYLPLVGR